MAENVVAKDAVETLVSTKIPQSSFTLEQLRRDFSLFDEDQKEVLEKIAKFSPKRTKLKVLKPTDMPLRKEALIMDNFTYLKMEDQIEFNDARRKLKDHSNYALAGAFGVGASLFIYYIVKAPLTRNLIKETVKSVGFATVFGIGYYKYHHNMYVEDVHDTYIKVLNAKKNSLTRPAKSTGFTN